MRSRETSVRNLLKFMAPEWLERKRSNSANVRSGAEFDNRYLHADTCMLQFRCDFLSDLSGQISVPTLWIIVFSLRRAMVLSAFDVKLNVKVGTLIVALFMCVILVIRKWQLNGRCRLYITAYDNFLLYTNKLKFCNTICDMSTYEKLITTGSDG